MLQLHQLRVAAVASQVCDSLTVKIDKQSIITACLLHDMGNVLKFDFSYPAQYFEPEGVEYWQSVQEEFRQKYGDSEHEASLSIARELGVSDKVLHCIASVGFSFAPQTAKDPEFEAKICDNADMRVSPSSVVSIEQRLEDGYKRYRNRPDRWMPEERREELVKACYEIQDQIFAHSRIKPADITNETIVPIIEHLKSYEI
ncbi:MAG TPA: HD domain-containing protein [Candidatus Saccharimonadales bacterium]|nr:HD domain-containing protein [Candidatus Saccharimonadales bacterium]